MAVQSSSCLRHSQIWVYSKAAIKTEQPQDPAHGAGSDDQAKLCPARTGVIVNMRQAPETRRIAERRARHVSDDHGDAGGESGAQQLTDRVRAGYIELIRERHNHGRCRALIIHRKAIRRTREAKASPGVRRDG